MTKKNWSPEKRREWRKRPEVKARLKEHAHKTFRTPKGRFNLARGAAKTRNIVWELSFEQYADLIVQNCFYCENPNPVVTGSGIDRKDSTLGYTLENVLSCCWTCNNIKRDNFTVEETKVMVDALMAFRKSKPN